VLSDAELRTLATHALEECLWAEDTEGPLVRAFLKVRDAALEEAALAVDGMPRSEGGYVCIAAVDIAARIYALKSKESTT